MDRNDRENLKKKTEKGIIFLGSSEKLWMAVEGLDTQNVKTEPVKAIVKKAAEDLLDKGKLFVVDSSDLERWCALMESFCLRYGRDYLDDVAFKYFFAAEGRKISVKKLAVMYGNCQMHDYFDSVNMSDDFCREYEAVYFKYLEYPRWKEDRLEFLLDLCDLLVYTKEGFDEKFRNVGRYVQISNPGCRCICIPTYCFRAYFPQTNAHIQEKGEFDVVAELFNSFHREDKYINRLIHQHLSKNEIVKKVMGGNCFSQKDLKKLLAVSLRQIEAMDRVSDITLFPFIQGNYRNVRLFKDPVHMENILVWHAAKQILRLLGIQMDLPVPVKTIHYFTQLPVYPEVKQALQLTWPEEDYSPQIRLAQGMIQVSMEEYTERYCDFAERACGIREALSIGENIQNVKEWFPGYGD